MNTSRKTKVGYNLSVTVDTSGWDSGQYYWLSGQTASNSVFSLTYNMGGQSNVWLSNYEAIVDVSKPIVFENAISNIAAGGYNTYLRYDSGDYVGSTLSSDVHVTMYC